MYHNSFDNKHKKLGKTFSIKNERKKTSLEGIGIENHRKMIADKSYKNITLQEDRKKKSQECNLPMEADITRRPKWKMPV